MIRDMKSAYSFNMISIISLLLIQVVLKGAQADDVVQPNPQLSPAGNDVQPDAQHLQTENNVQQNQQLPDGKLCLFTCSEWIFQEKVQQFAPSANLLGPGYLSKHTIGLPSGNNEDTHVNKKTSPLDYQKVWGAVYSIDKNEYDAVLKQSQAEYSIPFTSNEDVIVVKYHEMNCLVVDLGIQPGDHPPWRHFNMKIPNNIQDDAYYNQLAKIGVPQNYIDGLKNASEKPQYHPIIPQDYHVRRGDRQPVRTYDQLPAVPPRSNTINQGNPTVDHVGGNVPLNEPLTTVQPGDHDIHMSKPTVGDYDTSVLPGNHPQLLGTPGDQGNVPSTVQPGSHGLSTTTPNNQLQMVPRVPEDYQGNVPLTNVQPDTHDVPVTVPRDIDTGVATTPDNQGVVMITPMKIPRSATIQPIGQSPVTMDTPDVQIANPHQIIDQNPTTVQPLTIKPNGINQGYDQSLIPVPHDDSHYSLIGGVDDSPDKVARLSPEITTKPASNVVSGIPLQKPCTDAPINNYQQAPLDDQSYVVITPMKLPQNGVDTTSTPVTGQDFKVQTPDSLQPDSNLQTVTPNIISNDSTKPDDVPPILLGASKPKPNSLLLTPDKTTVSQAPDLLANPIQPGQQSGQQYLPTSYSIPNDNNVPNTSGLLTLSPNPDMNTYQQNSPLLTLNDVPQNDQPVNQMLLPNHSVSQPGVIDNTPNLVQTNTLPNHVQLHPTDNLHPIHEIPASFDVSKPTPIIPDKPMFSVDQSHPIQQVQTTPVEQSHPIQQTQTIPINNPQTIHEIPQSFDVPKPTPIAADIPMFSWDQSHPANQVQTTPVDNPQTIHHIPTTSSDLSTPAPNYTNKPMYGFDQSHPPSQIQTTPVDNPQTIHHIPTTSSDLSTPAPNYTNKPMFGFDQSHPPSQIQTTPVDNPQTIHHIPTTSSDLSTPAPNYTNKPMFGFDQSHPPSQIQTAPVDNPQTIHNIPTSPDLTKPAPNFSNKPMFNFDQSHPGNQVQTIPTNNPHSIQGIPASFDSSKPTPTVSDKPMFALDQPHPTNQVQTIPNNDLHTIHDIPASFDVSKPTPTLPDKPMFALDQSYHPDNTIPATFNMQTPPPEVNDKPMFTLDNSPMQLQPKHIDDDSHPAIPLSTSAIPINTVDQPHATGYLPSLKHDEDHPADVPLTSTTTPLVHQDDHPAQLVSKPDNAPLIANNPISTPIHHIPNSIDNDNHPVQLTSQPDLQVQKPLTVNNSPLTTQQVPNQVIDNDHPVQLHSQPDDSSMAVHPAVTHDNNPVQPISQQPDNSLLNVDHGPAVQPVNTVKPIQNPQVSAQPAQYTPPTYTPATFMVPNYMPASPALGYSIAHKYPQYLPNSHYIPPNCYYHPDELIPGFTFGSHIQLY